MGYNDETPGLIRVFGETEDSCQRQLEAVIRLLHDELWQWPRDAVQVEAMHTIGPWWCSRFERVPAGFEIVVRRID